jgi:membrane associated rhomboid family serine protease
MMKSLYLNHLHPQWWQWVTSIFCHANWRGLHKLNTVVTHSLIAPGFNH